MPIASSSGPSQGARGRSAPRGVPRDGAHRLPARGPGAAQLVRAGEPGCAAPAGRPPRRRGPRRRRGRRRLPGHRRRARPRRRPPGRRAGERVRLLCTAGGSSPATPSTICPTTASSTSSATSCRATASRSCACTASTSRSRVCEDLWQDGGPIAVAAARRGRARALHQRQPLRAGQVPHPRRARGPARPRGGRGAGLREHGGRPGRAGLRRRQPGRRRAGRALSRARRSSPRRC